jgi:hypothetical protein
LTVVGAVAGSQVAHALAYRLVIPDESAFSRQLAATGHSYLSYAATGLAVCAMLVLVALALELGHVLREPASGGSRPSAVAFAALAPGVFVCQEHFERWLHDGVFPWDAALEPTFALGLLLQLPFAVAAFLLARILLNAVRSLGRLLSRSPRAGVRVPDLLRPVSRGVVPRLPVLALGYGSRGPPALSR